MAETSSTPAPAAASPPPRPTANVDVHGEIATYVNFCRVTDTAEEVVIDLALMVQESSGAVPAVSAIERISLSLFTAKRLLGAMQQAIERHEQTFGPVETTVEKRLVRPQA